MKSDALLNCENLSYKTDTRSLFDNLSFNLGTGARLGIIGENGAGKSTLLSLIAGENSPTSGIITCSSKPKFIPQQIDVLQDQATVADEISISLEPILQVEKELAEAAKSLADGEKGSEDLYANKLVVAETYGVWSVEQRVERYLYGLGLADIPSESRIEQLSAGQRRRLALALALVSGPGILLLDEPTNYLDSTSQKFLEDEIAKWNGIVVFASHDRNFLENIPTVICDLDKTWASQYLYGGNYSNYLQHKKHELDRWKETYQNQQQEITDLEENIRGKSRNINHHRAMSDNNKKAYGARGDRVQSQISRRVRAAKERLETLQENLIPEPPEPLTLSVLPKFSKNHQIPVIAQLRSVCVENRINTPTTLDVLENEKYILVGPNGSGKTTILDTLSGKLYPSEGEIFINGAAKIGYLGHQDTFKNDHRTARAIYDSLVPETAGRLTSLGLLEDVDRNVNTLSTGQRKRLELAIILQMNADLLLFDEPTNHLSLRLCEELVPILSEWPSAIVIATHDIWLRQQLNWPTYSLGQKN